MPAMDGSAMERRLDPHDLLELHAWLCCQGPQAFLPDFSRAPTFAGPAHSETLEWLLAPANRQEASRRIGTQLAASLACRGRAAVSGLGSLLPLLLDVDLGAGYDVLRQAARSIPAPAARDFGDSLLTLALAEGADSGADFHPERVDRLVDALASMELPPEARARLFLALSQTLPRARVLDRVVPSALFPSSPTEWAVVLSEGTDEAVVALLAGAMARNRGRNEFFEACRQVVDAGLAGGILILGRASRLLTAGDPSVRALESLVRAALLPAMEKGLQKGGGAARGLVAQADMFALRLLAAVAPGLSEPSRSALCEAIVDRAGARLRAAQVGTLEADAFVEAVVSASVLHSDPDVPSAEVRRMLLDTAGSLRVQMFATEGPPEALFDVSMAFERAACSLGNEFRRRRPLASALASVLPLVSDLSAPPSEAAAPLWTD